jgi:hypothetical protein
MTGLAWLFPYLLFLHVLGAIAGFGPSFTFPLIGAMGGKERQHGNFATRVSETISSRLIYPIGITLPITGALMILVLAIDLTARSYWWLDIAMSSTSSSTATRSSTSASSSSGRSSSRPRRRRPMHRARRPSCPGSSERSSAAAC